MQQVINNVQMILRDTLIRCVTNAYQKNDVNRLIHLSHRQAVSYLRMKTSSYKSFMIRNENIHDLAWDFIAELFQKDDKGNLSELQSCFEPGSLKEITDADVTIELRKVVFTKVDDNLFRFYGDMDPSLKKIIRNIKLAVRDKEFEKEICYRDGYLIINTECYHKKTMMPADFLQLKLCSRLNGNMQIPEIMAEVIGIIDHQEDYRKQVSLVALAAIIRECFVLMQNESDNDRHGGVRPMAGEKILAKEFEFFLDKSVLKVKRSLGRRYVEKGKLKQEDLDLYFKAAAAIVKDDFSSKMNGLSQYDQFRKHVTGLEYEQFRDNYRSLLEYVVKLIRKDLISFFRKEWARS